MQFEGFTPPERKDNPEFRDISALWLGCSAALKELGDILYPAGPPSALAYYEQNQRVVKLRAIFMRKLGSLYMAIKRQYPSGLSRASRYLGIPVGDFFPLEVDLGIPSRRNNRERLYLVVPGPDGNNADLRFASKAKDCVNHSGLTPDEVLEFGQKSLEAIVRRIPPADKGKIKDIMFS